MSLSCNLLIFRKKRGRKRGRGKNRKEGERKEGERKGKRRKRRISTKEMSGRKRSLQTEAHTAKELDESPNPSVSKIVGAGPSGLHPLFSMCLKYTSMWFLMDKWQKHGKFRQSPLVCVRTRATMKSISVSIKKGPFYSLLPHLTVSPQSRSQCMTAQLPPTPLGKGHLVAGRAARLLPLNLLIASEGEEMEPLCSHSS